MFLLLLLQIDEELSECTSGSSIQMVPPGTIITTAGVPLQMSNDPQLLHHHSQDQELQQSTQQAQLIHPTGIITMDQQMPIVEQQLIHGKSFKILIILMNIISFGRGYKVLVSV